MRRHQHKAQELRFNPKLITLLTVAAAAAILATMFARPAPAEPRDTYGPSCPDGLMRLSEAGTGVLMLKTETPGCYLPPPRVVADINVSISGPVARTKVTQRFQNPADGWIEGVYVFPLPEGAAVDTLKMKIGEHFIEGQIRERQQARQIYEAAKAEGRKASLVEQERPNVFTNHVVNIGPHESISVQIEYQESLRFDAGRYHLRVPLVVAPRYSPPPRANLVQYDSVAQVTRSDPVPDRARLDAPLVHPDLGKVNPVSLAVNLEAGFPLGDVTSDSHAIAVTRNGRAGASIALSDGDVPADKDFTLTFAPVAGAVPTVSLLKEHYGASDYLLALVMPPSGGAGAVQRHREAIFVLDNSGSMGGESIREAKESLLLALDRLTPGDRFDVIRFDDTLTDLFARPVDATAQNVDYAKHFVSGIEARGGTEMLPALLAALRDNQPYDTTHLRQVIFLTDGEVGNEAELFTAIGQKLGRSRLFTVGIGSSPNAYFMSGAARAGRGTYTYIGSVDQVSARMAELFAKLEHPVMTELDARWPEGLNSEAWPNPLPDLYDGQPIIVTVKADNAQGTLTLSGNLDGTAWKTSLDLSQASEAAGIEKLWARNKISALDESRVRGVDSAYIDSQLLDIALAHHLTTRLTSLVAVDVTPSRPADENLTSTKVPLNLPDGWDADAFLGEYRSRAGGQAFAPPPPPPPPSPPAPVASTQLALLKAPAAAVATEDAGVVLPQTGTDSPVMFAFGVLFLVIAGGLMLRKRIASEGNR